MSLNSLLQIQVTQKEKIGFFNSKSRMLEITLVKHHFHRKDNNDVVLLCQPEVDQIQLLSTTANALSQRSHSLRLLQSLAGRKKTLHIYMYMHTYMHTYIFCAIY